VHHLHDHARGLFQHRRAWREVDAVEVLQRQRVAVGELFDLLRNLVQRRTQRLDILTLDRGDEAAHQFPADLVGGRTLAQARQLERIQRRLAAAVPEHHVQSAGAVVGGDGRLFEQRVELVALAENGLQGEHAEGPRVPGLQDRDSSGRNYDDLMTSAQAFTRGPFVRLLRSPLINPCLAHSMDDDRSPPPDPGSPPDRFAAPALAIFPRGRSGCSR